MKKIISAYFYIATLALVWNPSYGQDNGLSESYLEEVISKLSELMNDHYVFPEVAQATADHLMAELKAGNYSSIENHGELAKILTSAVQSINKDKHMKVWKNDAYEAPENTPERMIEEKLDGLDRYKWYNLGFLEAKVMRGNIGYISLSGFARVDEGKDMADAYMKLIEMTDAVIIDLSKNGGGDPSMVQYLCSYFFDKKVHLNSLYYRQDDRTIDFWTLDEVGGKKMPDVPLYVITGSRTFSGAEEFSYNMQTQKRATLIGQTTGGGANPGGTMMINDSLRVFIPTGRAINPITQTNWEGVGVIPEIKVSQEEALDSAITLALQGAKEYREDLRKKNTDTFLQLSSKLTAYKKGISEDDVHNQVVKCVDAGILNEYDINSLGYEYLMQYEQPHLAMCLFRSNKILHPESPNAYDSYGESLIATGNYEEVMENYNKAVELAAKYEEHNLEMYQKNRDMAKKKISGK